MAHQLRNKQIQYRLWEIDKYLLEKYKKDSVQKEIDTKEYEMDFMKRIKQAIKELSPLINEATKDIKINRVGRKSKLTIKQKLTLILIKQFVNKSNRLMAYMLEIFSMMTGINISYKTIERLYSNYEVELALHNLHTLMIIKKDIKEIDCCGDATGYGLIISKHYYSEVQKRRDKVKQQEGKKKKAFIFNFALMDLKTKMYVCYGTSLISEKDAFMKSLKMLKELNIRIKTIRLDRYYSFPCYVNLFGNSIVYIIPRKNSKLGHGDVWLKTMRRFLEDTLGYLKEYYKRVNSENGFSVDKKLFGDKIKQKREDRIKNALFCVCLWHNLFYLFS